VSVNPMDASSRSISKTSSGDLSCDDEVSLSTSSSSSTYPCDDGYSPAQKFAVGCGTRLSEHTSKNNMKITSRFEAEQFVDGLEENIVESINVVETVDQALAAEMPVLSLVSKINVNGPDTAVDESNFLLPIDQERQILLLMLLAQVCALHDPTPRTFTVHILELFERGILDRTSIHFLYDLGLVPHSSAAAPRINTKTPPFRSKSSPELLWPSKEATMAELSENKSAVKEMNQLALVLSSNVNALVPGNSHQQYLRQCSVEASSIRNSLKYLDHQQCIAMRSYPPRHDQQSNKNLPSSSWHIDDHPLSLSRYHREFDEIGLLASGSFGEVFHAINKMDGCDYAIKRVSFSAAGYSGTSVQQVIREVHCLAACDHPNVVRYFTSWWEPSWMTGSTPAVNDSNLDGETSDVISGPMMYGNLLTTIEQAISSENSPEKLSEVFQSYFDKPSLDLPSRRSSLDPKGYDDASWICFGDSSYEGPNQADLAVNEMKDDISVNGYYPRKNRHLNSMLSSLTDEALRSLPYHTHKSPQYKYQISLYMQMQLCHPATLADWIRTRNQTTRQDLHERLDVIAEVFAQIVHGLHHVHERNIVHRDLKPSNIFASADGLHFKIGDFGLSKLVNCSSASSQTGGSPSQKKQFIPHRRLAQQPELVHQHARPENGDNFWSDHHTAGVGTASYAAPEQVVSQTYGTSADVFSLGLILLELACCFSTEHERLQTFHDCRQRRTLPVELNPFPELSQVILSCTDSKAANRPTAADLKFIQFFSSKQQHQPTPKSDTHFDGTLDDVLSVESMKRNLAETRDQLRVKEEQLHECRRELGRKNDVIAQLRQEILELNGKNSASVNAYKRS
jgi:serine/threonine protein kinase